MKDKVKGIYVPKVKRVMSKYSFYLYVLSLLKTKRPSQICDELGMTKQSLNYHIRFLEGLGYIKKLGHGVWLVIKDEVKNVDVGRSKSMSKIRSHGFGFYLKIPQIKNWNDREDYLNKNNIKYEIDNLKQGQHLQLKGFHIYLFNKGIRFMQMEGFEGIFTDSATLGNEIASRRLLRIIKALERLLGANFAQNKGYQVKITRQHHALVKNELASLYNKQGQRLQVFDHKGLWLLIDNSFNLDELEAVHGTTANLDMDNAIKPFFNSLKEAPFTAYDFKELYGVSKEYALNIKLHLQTLKEMQEALRRIGNNAERS